jgi:hypothetical protein
MSLLPPMGDPDPAVQTILDRAERLSLAEAGALDATVRALPSGNAVARRALDDHQLWKNQWAMFDHWPDPAIEMGWAREVVAAALGLRKRRHDAVEVDDGTIAWGAATAAAYAVLAAGRAGADPTFRTAWDGVIGPPSGTARRS